MMLEEIGPHRLIAEDLGEVPTLCEAYSPATRDPRLQDPAVGTQLGPPDSWKGLPAPEPRDLRHTRPSPSQVTGTELFASRKARIKSLAMWQSTECGS